jgi:Kef-type K+ transport system membrane component KefB
MQDILLIFAVILLVAAASNIVERFGQPPVVGQLLAGIALSAAGYFGWDLMREAAANPIVAFLAGFGAIILLLSAGMESKTRSLAKVGLRAAWVAAIGVVLPFTAGAYWLGPWLFPDETTNAYLFLGAALVATSVGVAVAVFRALGAVKSRAAQTVLAAAVFDDIIGLVILGVLTELVADGRVGFVGVVWLVSKALIFLLGALYVGRVIAPAVARFMSKLNDEPGTKLVFAVALALVLAWVAELVGLQAIIGAFAAGLLLEGMTFEDYGEGQVVDDLKELKVKSLPADRSKINRIIAKHRRAHLGGMVDVLGTIAVPVFFVYSGLQVDFGVMLESGIYLAALAIAAVAIVAKVASGLAAQGNWRGKLAVGLAMTPRGEVGLIFAATALTLGVFDSVLYSTVVLAILITTFIAPPLLVRLLHSR